MKPTAASRRELLLGLVGAGASSLVGCTAKWNPQFADKGWHNNINTRCITPRADETPRSLGEIVALVKAAEKGQLRVRAVGAGHSFSDASFADGLILRTLALDRTIPLEPRRLKPGIRTDDLFQVEAGIQLQTLNEALTAAGKGLLNMGGWDHQTLGGAISTSTHGSGLRYGPYPAMVRSLIVVTAGGRVVQFEPANGPTNPDAFAGVVLTPCGPYPAELVQCDDAFRSVLVAMGSMGVIYAATIEVEPRFWLHERRTLSSWEDVTAPGGYLATIVNEGAPPPGWNGQRADYYELLLNPYQTGGQHTCILTERTKIPWKVGRAPLACRGRGEPGLGLIETLGIASPWSLPDEFNSAPADAGWLLDQGMMAILGDCYEAASYDVFNSGSINLLRAYSVDIGVDIADTAGFVSWLLHRSKQLADVRIGVHSAPWSIRFVKECDAYLSPQNGRRTTMVEVFTQLGVLGTDALELRHEREAMVKFRARPHWGLDLSAIEGEDAVRNLYPSFDKWHDRYKTYNASGVFNGEITDRLGISMPGNAATRKSYQCIPLP